MPERTMRLSAVLTTELDDYELARWCRDLEGPCPSEEFASFAGVRPHCMLCAGIGGNIACHDVTAKDWAQAFKSGRGQEEQ